MSRQTETNQHISDTQIFDGIVAEKAVGKNHQAISIGLEGAFSRGLSATELAIFAEATPVGDLLWQQFSHREQAEFDDSNREYDFTDFVIEVIDSASQ